MHPSHILNWSRSVYIFPWQQLELTRRACPFDVGSGLSSGLTALGCVCTVLCRNPLGLKKKKERVEAYECGDVLVQCENIASWSVNVCGAAEATKEQAGK